MTRAAIYTRLSLDRNGEGVAVARQREDCLRIAEQRGWSVVGEFCDNSLSAWRAGVRRPGWEAMLDTVADGRVDALIVWHGDRLIRQPRDLERLIDLAEGGLTIASVAGERDLAKSDDRFILRIETAAQCRESDSTSRRVKRALEARAMQGKRTGKAVYGWRTEDEAVVVQRICRDVLAGRSIRMVTRELNAEGVPSPTGGEWDKSSVRYVAKRPANAGLRTHKGEVVAEAEWDALITRDEHEAIVRRMTPAEDAPDTRTRRWLLTGILRCGKCGAAVLRAPVRGGVYRCSAQAHLAVRAEAVDEFVLTLAQGRLELPDMARAGEVDGGERTRLLARIESGRRVADEFAEDYAAGLISREAMRTGVATAEARARAAEVALTALESRAGVLAGMPADITTAPLDVQRATIRALMNLTLLPDTGGRGRWARIEDRIAVEWVTDADTE